MFPSGGVTPLWANNGIFNRPPFWFPLPLTLHGTGKDDALPGFPTGILPLFCPPYRGLHCTNHL
jgi:hypothetical protein